MTDTVQRAGEAGSGRRSPLTHVPLSKTPLPALDPQLKPWPGEIETAGGVSLHTRRTPGSDEATAVYVHGLGGSSTNWTDLAALLSPFASGISVDLPGFGFSEPVEGFRFSLDEHADELGRFVEGLGAGPVHLLGNSMGGAVVLLLAAKRPELVRSLTLISPAMPDRRPDPRRLSDPLMALAYLPVIGRGVRKRLASLSARERAEQVIKLCFADPDAFPAHRLDELVEEHNARAELKWANAAMAASTFGIFRTWFARGAASLWAVAPQVRVPSLVVWGTQDKVISVRRAARTANALPRARLLVLPRTGHVAQMERPVPVARAVLGMWERLEGNAW
ncbi:pimeloyl-ACP methyl ester carboxylesterase [Amycolatopsis bartoniae]|uniref:Hydrolase n=1 Tax=Amycolatopsis bartoniae TaxID=941986 RepID=A0A8H9J2U5_9PSEU|nr:alpha/beta fold hydrolase [Amycolatopsis bartoniae]MBB2938894.1 pimeloyl-ACP methyl ester carboxylesterase [Amycolatopsis bartoniae]TVS99702.1 alpha/beta fold hydrolase [Amycolatopsis bartoniae]GHF77432.1 hydrolase [Amycolatopsis bartoniae]